MKPENHEKINELIDIRDEITADLLIINGLAGQMKNPNLDSPHILIYGNTSRMRIDTPDLVAHSIKCHTDNLSLRLESINTELSKL